MKAAAASERSSRCWKITCFLVFLLRCIFWRRVTDGITLCALDGEPGFNALDVPPVLRVRWVCRVQHNVVVGREARLQREGRAEECFWWSALNSRTQRWCTAQGRGVCVYVCVYSIRVPWRRGIGSGVQFLGETGMCGPAAVLTALWLCWSAPDLDWSRSVCSRTAGRPPRTGNLRRDGGEDHMRC